MVNPNRFDGINPLRDWKPQVVETNQKMSLAVTSWAGDIRFHHGDGMGISW